MLNWNTPAESLHEIGHFGTNPGRLKAFLHLPPDFASGAPLVVALHGCTQDAADFADGSGWSTLADRAGFAVLYPAQQRLNNPHLCFNWFEPADTRRDHGEAGSIRQMIDHVIDAHGIDRKRIFVTGLSAGGAMANAMLANYPELFEAGAIVAGLPFGTAKGVSEAFERMQGRHPPAAGELRRSVRRAAPKSKHWPRISVWQGKHDHTVRPANAEMIVEQWLEPHALRDKSDRTEKGPGYNRRLWQNAKGNPVVECWIIERMGHGVPLDPDASEPIGRIGPYMLEAGISSTLHIAAFFGLVTEKDLLAAGQGKSVAVETGRVEIIPPPKPRAAKTTASTAEQKITATINKALRAAGLLR